MKNASVIRTWEQDIVEIHDCGEIVAWIVWDDTSDPDNSIGWNMFDNGDNFDDWTPVGGNVAFGAGVGEDASDAELIAMVEAEL